MQQRTSSSFITATQPLGRLVSPESPDDTVRRVAASRVNALLGATESRLDWLKRLGIQAPLQFAWMLARAQRLSASHLDYLKGGCFDGLRGSERLPADSEGATMFATTSSGKDNARRPQKYTNLLYRSVYYSWINYDLLLALSEGWISGHTAEVLRRFSQEMRRLLDDLEAFDPGLGGGEDGLAFLGDRAGLGQASCREQAG